MPVAKSAASNTVGVAVPSVPQNLTITLGSDRTSATVAWQRVTNAIGYQVTRIPDDGSDPTTLPEVTPAPMSRLSIPASIQPPRTLTALRAIYPTSIAVDGTGSLPDAANNIGPTTIGGRCVGPLDSFAVNVDDNGLAHFSWQLPG